MNKSEKMKSYLNRATKIMDRVEAISPKTPSKGMPGLNESMAMEGFTNPDQSYYGESYDTMNYDMNQNTSMKGKLPSGIYESFMDNPLNNTMNGLSVLDNIIEPKPQKRMNNYDYEEKQTPTTEELFMRKQKMRLNENYVPQNNSVNQIIDYSLISSIIKAAISEEMQKLRKTILSESKQNSASGDVIVKLDSGIQFITKNGNIYEGKLVKTGNVKDYR